MTAAKGATDFLKIAEEGLEITSCWANINTKGGTTKPHTHPNNYLSGVYYVDTSASAYTIVAVSPYNCIGSRTVGANINVVISIATI